MKYFKVLFLLCSLLCLKTFANVFPNPSGTLFEKSWGFYADFLYSKTTSYYDVDGVEESLEEEQDFQLMDTRLRLDYGWSKRFQVGSDLLIRQLESVDSGGTTSNSGLESVGVHFKYSFKGSPSFKSSVGFSYRFKLYSNNVYQDADNIPEDEIVLGDDGQEFDFRYYFDYFSSKTLMFSGQIAYRLPPNDLSAEFPFKFQITKKMKHYAFSLGAEGIMSQGSDEYQSNPDDKAQNATGSTNRFNSINRQIIMPFGSLHMLLGKKYSLGVQFSKSVSGASNDGRSELLTSLTWNTGGVTTERQFEDKFKEYSAEANIIKISPRGVFFKIDKGLSQDIVKGARADIYKSDYFGGNVLIATGFIYESAADWAIVKVVKKFRNMAIEKGFTVRVK